MNENTGITGIYSSSEKPEFIKRLMTDDYTKAPAALCFGRLGGHDPESGIEVEGGPVYFSLRNFGETALIDITFRKEDSGNMLKMYRLLEDYLLFVDSTTGEHDEDHILSMMFTENFPYRTGMLIGSTPLFFALTSTSMVGEINTIRIAFYRDGMAAIGFDPEDPEADDAADKASAEKQESPENGWNYTF